MHISDGGLTTPVCIATYAITAVGVAYAMKSSKDEDVPKISLMAGTFFAISLIMVPVPPTSVHPLLCGLIGIILGKKSPLAFFPALLLQAIMFQHGGITTLGANTMTFSLSAMLSGWIFHKLKGINIGIRGAIVGALSVVIIVTAVACLLMVGGEFSKETYVLIYAAHGVIMIVEAVLTGFAVKLIGKAKPQWITK